MVQPLSTPPNSPIPSCIEIRSRLKKHLRTDNEADVPEHKRFFPEHRVRSFFTLRIVEALLECSCFKCHGHRRIERIKRPTSYSSQILPDPSTNRHGDSGCVILLALLVYIECPALIYAFINEGCGDGPLKSETAKFTSEYVLKTLWRRFPPGDVEEYAEEFEWKKSKFAIPRVEGNHYEEFPSCVILPFVNERQIGRMTADGEIVSEGHFGDVYSFDILEEHCNFPEYPGIRTFARKELRRHTPHKHFRDELDNLLRVKKLQDRHIIKVVKSYKHGDVYNFIFPYAKTNLNLFIREPTFRPFSDFTGAVLQHPLWKQMLGIARGLHKVSDYELPDTTSDNSFYGYHFDLKPANILVDWSDNLVITDFGQARFKKADGTSSRVTGLGGNEAYAPPEIDEDEVVNNRKYDVWSLGCILLEVSTFVVRGHTGLWELDTMRSREDKEARIHDDRFFRRIPISSSDQLTPWRHRSGAYELKPQIYQWIQHLPECIPDQPSRDFLNKILLVILQMLHVDVNSRLSSREVCLRLSDVIEDRQIGNGQDGYNLRMLPERPSQGHDIGIEHMASVRPISYNLQGYWHAAPLFFIQDTTFLYTQTFEDPDWIRRSLGKWSQLKLIPQYALQDRGNQSVPDAAIFLAPKYLHGVSQRKYAKFWTPNIPVLQEILLAQKVNKHIKLKNAAAKLKQAKSLSRLVGRKKSNDKHGNSSDSLEAGAHNVQLWTEAPRHDMIGPDRTERRRSPRSLRLGPGFVRIVVFYQRSILILRLAKNQRIGQSEGEDLAANQDASSTSVVIVPYIDASFPVSVLRPAPDELLPGFSLSRDDFEAQENENRVECCSIKLDFVSRDDAESFHRAYKRLKKQWSNQVKEFQSLQIHIGEEIGYNQST